MAQNEEKVVLHHEDRRWRFLSIIFISLCVLSSITSVSYIINLPAKNNNLTYQNILLQQQVPILKVAKQEKDIPQVQYLKQYRIWDPSFIPIYVSDYVLGAINNKYRVTPAAYCHIFFEAQAYEAEEQKYPPDVSNYNYTPDCTY